MRLLDSVYSLVELGVGREKLTTLVSRCSNSADATETLTRLRTEAQECHTSCRKSELLPKLDAWEKTRRSPWLGMLSADVDFEDVELFFQAMEEYTQLPRGWPGFKFERWARSRQISDLFERADSALRQMLDEVTSA